MQNRYRSGKKKYVFLWDKTKRRGEKITKSFQLRDTFDEFSDSFNIPSAFYTNAFSRVTVEIPLLLFNFIHYRRSNLSFSFF